ncbi:predicted protein [Sclerotinia sclerotiorum 1980 UF-70]|uniref:Uncharacterized protein n=1 Tax=Sclerotinia sclerotiorum (strain ATCC 18683 / 1980 / Ss-1) TaxID=665079 RepID=A7E4A6_SCLS1|nr:predicted protein [Sclerotinia sclerotiorum 1980 UF-70]EDN90728.1 predicted protein [Sclerotinia sclerotiorum 1980 UF-70]
MSRPASGDQCFEVNQLITRRAKYSVQILITSVKLGSPLYQTAAMTYFLLV